MSSSPLPFAVSTGAVWLLGCRGQCCVYLDVFGFRLCSFLCSPVLPSLDQWWPRSASPARSFGPSFGWSSCLSHLLCVVGCMLVEAEFALARRMSLAVCSVCWGHLTPAVSPVLSFLWFSGCFGYFYFYFTGCVVLARTVVVLWLVLARTVVVLWLSCLFSFFGSSGIHKHWFTCGDFVQLFGFFSFKEANKPFVLGDIAFVSWPTIMCVV